MKREIRTGRGRLGAGGGNFSERITIYTVTNGQKACTSGRGETGMKNHQVSHWHLRYTQSHSVHTGRLSSFFSKAARVSHCPNATEMF